MDKIKGLLSRKFLTMVISGIVLPFLASHGVPPAVVDWIATIALTWIGGESLIDAARAHRAATVPRGPAQ